MWLRIKEIFNLPLLLAIIFLTKAYFTPNPIEAWKYSELGMFWLVISRIDYTYERLMK